MEEQQASVGNGTRARSSVDAAVSRRRAIQEIARAAIVWQRLAAACNEVDRRTQVATQAREVNQHVPGDLSVGRVCDAIQRPRTAHAVHSRP
jgi:hypothetical protein